jgi:hypothetical protein
VSLRERDLATARRFTHLFLEDEFGDRFLSGSTMSDETSNDRCKDCAPTFAAFLEQMAAHNKEQLAELNAPEVVCPTCGKVHKYTSDASKASTPRAS